MQSREEKQLDSGIESILQRVNDLKMSIQTFIAKLENDYHFLDWKSVLANFSLISGQITLLSRFLKNEKMPNLKSYVMLPYFLSQVEDPNLKQLTEGRVPFCNHEVVPSYLRTKPEPEVEEKMAQLQNKSNSLSQDNLQKQINTFNKLATTVHETLKNSRDNLEGDPVQKGMLMQITSTNDTYNLVAAITNGKGLRANQSSSQSQHIPESRINIPQPQTNVMPSMNVNKMTSSIKMNIKSGSSGQHTYNR